jgi:uncharacterized membrane protein
MCFNLPFSVGILLFIFLRISGFGSSEMDMIYFIIFYFFLELIVYLLNDVTSYILLDVTKQNISHKIDLLVSTHPYFFIPLILMIMGSSK